MHCANCGPSETDVDDKLGHVVCLECGQVLMENTITSELTFTEQGKKTIADGFTIQNNLARIQLKQGPSDSRLLTITNGFKKTTLIGTMLKIPERLIQQSQRLFKLALELNFTKTNLHQLGATFLSLLPLVTTPSDKIPIVDPSLFISRFAAKLDFGESTLAVVKDANRIIQRMNRDWMLTGRRPSGLCAASLFVAARMHGFSRSINELSMVVKICQGTLRKRLQEFKDTPSGKLNVSDFQTIWLEDYQDPPAFNIKKKRKVVDNVEALPIARGNVLVDEEEDIIMPEQIQDILVTQSSAFPKSYFESMNNANQESLSDLDNDPEVVQMTLVSEVERDFKELVWNQTNQDWVLQNEMNEIKGVKKKVMDIYAETKTASLAPQISSGSIKANAATKADIIAPY